MSLRMGNNSSNQKPSGFRVIYVDPDRLAKRPKRWEFDPETDWIVLDGFDLQLPDNQDRVERGLPCLTCGCRKDDPLVRRHEVADDFGRKITGQRRGRVVCSDCCKASMDGLTCYPGLGVDAAPDQDWLKQYENDKSEVAAEPTKYTADGMQERVLTRREKRANKKGVKA